MTNVSEYLEARFSLAGRKALVTGGGRGLGRAMTLALANAGADTAIVSRTQAEVVQTANAVQALGRKAIAIAKDLAVADQVAEAYHTARSALGQIDILVNGAGIMIRKGALDATLDDWERIMHVNLRAAFLMAQYAAREMCNNGWGRIVNIASLVSVLARPNTGLYAMTKGGILQLTRNMAVEFSHYGVTVNAIAPGYFRSSLTEQLFQDPPTVQDLIRRIPIGRTGVGDDLEGAVVFLCSQASAYVTGQVLFVDGGWTIT